LSIETYTIRILRYFISFHYLLTAQIGIKTAKKNTEKQYIKLHILFCQVSCQLKPNLRLKQSLAFCACSALWRRSAAATTLCWKIIQKEIISKRCQIAFCPVGIFF